MRARSPPTTTPWPSATGCWRAGGRTPAWLAGLEDAMARHGVAATAARRGLVARLNGVLAAGAHRRLSRRAPRPGLPDRRRPGRAAGAGGGGGAARGLGADAGGTPPRAGRRAARTGPTWPDPSAEGPAGGAVLDRGAEGAADLGGAGACRADRRGARLRAAAAAGRGCRAPGRGAPGGAVRGVGDAARAGLPDRHGCRGFPPACRASRTGFAPARESSLPEAETGSHCRAKNPYIANTVTSPFRAGASAPHERASASRARRLQQRLHHRAPGPGSRAQAARHVHRRHR